MIFLKQSDTMQRGEAIHIYREDERSDNMKILVKTKTVDNQIQSCGNKHTHQTHKKY